MVALAALGQWKEERWRATEYMYEQGEEQRCTSRLLSLWLLHVILLHHSVATGNYFWRPLYLMVSFGNDEGAVIEG
jgi:hypothetical protein